MTRPESGGCLLVTWLRVMTWFVVWSRLGTTLLPELGVPAASTSPAFVLLEKNLRYYFSWKRCSFSFSKSSILWEIELLKNLSCSSLAIVVIFEHCLSSNPSNSAKPFHTSILIWSELTNALLPSKFINFILIFISSPVLFFKIFRLRKPLLYPYNFHNQANTDIIITFGDVSIFISGVNWKTK